MLEMVKMKRGQVGIFLLGLLKFKDNKNGTTNWKYSVFKNIKICQEESDAHPKGVAEQLENKRMLICDELCSKDEFGKPIIADGKYKIDDMIEFNRRYSELYNSMKSEITDYNEFMKSEVELAIYVVAMNDLPSEIKYLT